MPTADMMTGSRTPFVRFLLALAVLAATAFPSHAAEDNAVVAEALRSLFQSGKADTGSEAANAALPSVREIYEIRDFKPIWVRDAGPKTKAKALLAELKISGVHGLSPDFYHVAEIEALMGVDRPCRPRAPRHALVRCGRRIRPRSRQRPHRPRCRRRPKMPSNPCR